MARDAKGADSTGDALAAARARLVSRKNRRRVMDEGLTVLMLGSSRLFADLLGSGWMRRAPVDEISASSIRV
ncbi:hypothetical protein AS156_20700 [Bradyrhizobium macuxiense]|uniref:Uncharacterized protein n=1 Tax=Bradyrhizobium macuxiense TaxID=1755647 RepID=A0A125Q653_9BRAD|nr:hypothetical protein AS156_20700 [Bradyrhizobium macuxiense]